MNICLIPARGGSKRIPQKNIRNFHGKPIIAYSILAALESKCFDRIIVSTDNDEIAEISKQYGAEVPFIRPAELSDDYTGTTEVVKHAIDWLEKKGPKYNYICCLYATAPFVNSEQINDAFKKLKLSGADYCFSATSYNFPIQRAIKLTKNDRVEMFDPKYYSIRSQDLEDSYHDAGQFYWGKVESFREQKKIFSNFSTPYLLPSYLVQDIDSIEDWTRAELMFEVINNK